MVSDWESRFNHTRKKFLENILSGLGFNVLLINLIFQLGAGKLRNIDFFYIPSSILIVFLPLSLIFSLITPERYFLFTTKSMKGISNLIFSYPVLILISLLYLLTLPYAKIINKNNYLKTRPNHNAWVVPHSNWRVGTWVDKNFEYKENNKNVLLNLVATITSGGNWFISFVTIILIILTSLIFFAQSSAIAPFIYTLF